MRPQASPHNLVARENSLWKWLKPVRIHFREKLVLGRLENSVGAGWPDVEGFLEDYGQIWIELKSAARPADPLTNVDLKHTRDAQVRWLSKRWAMQQRVFILIQVGSGYAALRYLIPGNLAQDLQDGQTEAWLKANSWSGPTAKRHEVLLACFKI